MDKTFWHDRWQRHEIGFHQPHVHEQLRQFWQKLAPPPNSTVFVPLSGKSRDMTWLAEQGHTVIGVELSEIAIKDFFDEAGLTPSLQSLPPFNIWSAGPYKLWCGDIFALPLEAVADAAAVYDRAALIALPVDMRRQYAHKLTEIVPRSAPIFLITLDYPEGEITGPPFSVTESEINDLFADHFTISVLEKRDGLAASDNLKKRGVTRLEETAYLLRRKQ